jgi:hypothetical protein
MASASPFVKNDWTTTMRQPKNFVRGSARSQPILPTRLERNSILTNSLGGLVPTASVRFFLPTSLLIMAAEKKSQRMIVFPSRFRLPE